MEVTPLWVDLASPAITLLIVVGGFFYSKIKLEQKVLTKNEEQDKDIKFLTKKYEIMDDSIRAHSFCSSCPQMIRLQSAQNENKLEMASLKEIAMENQRDIKVLIKETAEVNAKAGTAIETMSKTMDHLRSIKFISAVEKVNGTKKQ